MLLMLVLYDGIERGYEVPDGTILASCLRDGYWFFQTTEGGQVVLSSEIVNEARLGNVALVPPD